jgi:hypothetical protein
MTARPDSARIQPLTLAAIALVAALGAGIEAPRADTWAHDPALNTPVVRAPQGQCLYGLVPDGKDGALMTVAEPCTLFASSSQHFPELNYHLFHLRRGDGVDPTWTAGGIPLPFTSNQGLQMLEDFIGGAYLGWADTHNLATTGRDVDLLRVRKDGTLDPAFPPSGLVVCNAPGSQLTPHLCSDGGGGILLAWSDRRDSLTNLSDVYAAHVKPSGVIDPGYPVNGRAIYTGPANQSCLAALPDGFGGAYVLWSDRRNGAANHADIYAQHLFAYGAVDPAWPVGGLAVAATTADENYDGALSDGSGGYFVTWEDFVNGDVGVVHFLKTGTLDPAWPAGGPVLMDPGTFSYASQMMPDGTGGLLVLWTEAPDPDGVLPNMYARHVLANGTLDPTLGPTPRLFAPTPNYAGLFDSAAPIPDPAGGGLVSWSDMRPDAPGMYALRVRGDLTPAPGWKPTGLPIAIAAHSNAFQGNVASGASGAIYAFTDTRDSVANDFDVYAQRVSERGRLGVDEPVLASIRDVAADQGGRALVRWYWSSYDTLPAPAVAEYDVWRELDGAALTADRRAAAQPASAIGAAPAPGTLRVSTDGALDTFWEFLGSTPARGTSSYALAVPTLGDSSAAGGALETYEVDAHLAPTNEIFTSPPDSGYSVDNLAPAAPTGFAGAYAGGTATLHWDPVIAADLASYRLYRGVPSTFTPSPANRIALPTTTNYTDPAGATYYYKLTAADVHGNESAAATLLPTGALTGVEDTVAVALAFGRPSPDPALERTRFTYALPHAGRVRILVFDLAGRLVRRLVDGAETAGVHGRDWDLADDRGARVRTGMYFARFEAAGVRMERRVLVAR